MEKVNTNEGATVYSEPVIEDYGTLHELTASGGASFTDVPSGTPVNGNIGNVAGSTP
jgi:hypothetical protein